MSNPIILCNECNERLLPGLGDEAICYCGALQVEHSPKGYIRVHTSSKEGFSHHFDEEE